MPKMVSNFPKLVAIELDSARDQHNNLASAHEAYAVILEELDEFKVEVFKRRGQRDRQLMLAELVQVAAMCQRAAEDIRLLPVTEHQGA